MEVEFSDGFLRRETLIEVAEELCLQVEIALYLWNKGRAGMNSEMSKSSIAMSSTSPSFL
jgi:hypothetical protein